MSSGHKVSFIFDFFLITLVAALVAAVFVAFAWAQGPMPPGSSVTSLATPTPPPSGEEGGWMVFGFVIAMVVIFAIAGRLLDLKSKREADAVHLEAQISDALLRDPRLCRLPVAASVRLPVWRRSPVTIKVVSTSCRGTWAITPNVVRGKEPVKFVGETGTPPPVRRDAVGQ